MTVIVGRGLGMGPRARAGGRLRREVVVPVPAYRRVTSLIGLSLVLVLVASAVDAVVWTYQSQRRLWRDGTADGMRPASSWHETRQRRWATAPDAVRSVRQVSSHRHAGALRCVYEPAAMDGHIGTVRCQSDPR